MDNSPSVILGRIKLLYVLCDKLKLLKPEQRAFIEVVKKKNIRYGSATKLPFKDHTMDVVYSSHTIEHLYEEDFVKFMREAERVLRPGGTFRLAIPDLDICVKKYAVSKDGDALCTTIHMGSRHKPTLAEKLSFLMFGDRKHKWMYNGESMKKFIETHSNFKAVILPAGKTEIVGETGINLKERESESVYLECRVNGFQNEN